MGRRRGCLGWSRGTSGRRATGSASPATGSYSVYRDQVTALQGWTATSALRQGSAWNELRVLATGSSLQFYLNDILVWNGSDASFTSGRVGVGIYRGAGTKRNGLLIDYATLAVPEDP